jgi:hypothetical protein
VSLGPPPGQRRREISIGPVGPWGALITVDAVSTNHGRSSTLPHDYLFEVGAEWVGAPAVGFPPSRTPVSSRDVVVVETLEEARGVAHKAADWFRVPGDQAPDLRDFLSRMSNAFARGPARGPDA